MNDFVNFCVDVLIGHIDIDISMIGQFDKNENRKFYFIYHSRNLSIVVASDFITLDGPGFKVLFLPNP